MSVLGSTANWRTVKTISCARNSICGLDTPIATNKELNMKIKKIVNTLKRVFWIYSKRIRRKLIIRFYLMLVYEIYSPKIWTPKFLK
jgi:hypothetical protein